MPLVSNTKLSVAKKSIRGWEMKKGLSRPSVHALQSLPDMLHKVTGIITVHTVFVMKREVI